MNIPPPCNKRTEKSPGQRSITIHKIIQYFVNSIKKFTYDFEDICSTDILEFEKIFDNLDSEYEEGVKIIKGLNITNRNLV